MNQLKVVGGSSGPLTIHAVLPDGSDSDSLAYVTIQDPEYRREFSHFICLAVNSHAALVSACQHILGLSANEKATDLRNRLILAQQQARTALALAHGTKEQQ